MAKQQSTEGEEKGHQRGEHRPINHSVRTRMSHVGDVRQGRIPHALVNRGRQWLVLSQRSQIQLATRSGHFCEKEGIRMRVKVLALPEFAALELQWVLHAATLQLGHQVAA